MKIYFSPLSCSLATRVVAYELARDVTFEQVNLRTLTTKSGADYLGVHPLGVVPALARDSGTLTENSAILLHLARGTELAPAARQDALLQWLSFVATEVHKGVFRPFFDADAPDACRAYAEEKAKRVFAYLDAYLQGRSFLLSDFSVADAYLLTTLNWAQATPIKLQSWPAVAAYAKRGLARPSFRKALAEELPLYQEMQKATLSSSPS